jgi:hypothetical protein
MATSFDPAAVGVNIQQIVSAILNPDVDNPVIPVIRANQNKIRPTDDTFVTYKLLGIAPLGQAQVITDPNNADMFRIVQDNELVVNFQSWGVHSKLAMSRVQNQLWNNPLISEQLAAMGLAVKAPASIVDTTALLDTSYEPRDIMDVTFNVTIVEDNINLGWIEHISINAIYEIAEDVVVLTQFMQFDKP